MRLDDFDYELPGELVAQVPAPERTAARLLVHEIEADRTTHASVATLPEFLRPGDLLVANDTRVRPLRLFGRRESGGRVELLFVEQLAEDADGRTWRALVKGGRKLRPGEPIALGEDGDGCSIEMVERRRDAAGELDPAWVVRWNVDAGEVGSWIDRLGRMPLPPYIARERDGDERDELDRERYQTVFARNEGAVAAPTAGLHFTPELLAALEERGVERAQVTLHVGEGTFAPVKVEDAREHVMHSERFVLGEDTVRQIRACRERGGRVVAVGTTSARVLESCVDEHGDVKAASGETRLYLYPGRELRVVDALFTNFHLPKSTLLLLVSAFAGRERILELYREAVRERYRFFSYGDAMLLSR